MAPHDDGRRVVIVDARRLEPAAVLRARVCVVGSGMGGSAVARTLADAHQDVLVVEAGGVDPASGDAAAVAADQVGRPFGIPVTRCIELGGTSNQWHGICAPLDELDFEPRPWIGGSGWPFRRAQLMPYYEAAAAALGVAPVTSDDERAFDSRLNAIEVNRAAVDRKLFQWPDRPKRWKPWLLGAARARTIRCLVNAPALELVVGPDGTSIDRLIVGTGSGTASIYAEQFVICAGTLETPRLLLNSRRAHPEGIGNRFGLVGRNLLDHPVGHFCKLKFHQPQKAEIYSGLALTDSVKVVAGLTVTTREQRRLGLPNHYLNVRPCLTPARLEDALRTSFLSARGIRDLSLRQLGAIVTHRELLYRILVTRFGVRPKYRYGDLVFMTEQLPNPNSRVTLSGRQRDRYGFAIAQVDWQLSDDDFRAFGRFTDFLLGQGLRSSQYTVARRDVHADWMRTVTSAAHHLGTARMSDHPQRGVVGADLRVFGMQNLFVCDGSVFPTSGSANPSLTITALGLRLGAHLVRRQRPLAWSTTPATGPSAA